MIQTFVCKNTNGLLNNLGSQEILSILKPVIAWPWAWHLENFGFDKPMHLLAVCMWNKAYDIRLSSWQTLQMQENE